MRSKIFSFFTFFLILSVSGIADDGYRLWLKYDMLPDEALLEYYRSKINVVYVAGNGVKKEIISDELHRAVQGLLAKHINFSETYEDADLVIALQKDLPDVLNDQVDYQTISENGYYILNVSTPDRTIILLTAKDANGLLYGTFGLIRLMQTGEKVDNLNILENPKVRLRLLNHWDNLDRTIERGYAGFSLWDWQKLPEYIHPYYRDYARANASIGINGTVLNNVNANPWILQPLYLKKVAALADVFRPYGLKVYLSVRFSSPKDIGGLSTADPLNEDVRNWWRNKIDEIYKLIPDFGGFLVKANSEGQPGPQQYNRTHADGANMLAEFLEPYGGVVMWRAFVYDFNVKEDRARQAYNEFVPLDGKFRKNVLVQVKNGPIDFQPREPFHPLFGAMNHTPLMMEFQITQEYLGFSSHLVYLAVLYEEVLDFDTQAHGKNSTVGNIIDGSFYDGKLTGMAGVANTGTDRNWTGHIFGQANWYAFGRLAWDHELSAGEIADEWIRMTLTHQDSLIQIIKKIMMMSREAAVNYMTPLGLHHLMGWGHHYGPAPWIKDKGRADWTPVYYHQADSIGIGFDRTSTGSKALEQYAPEIYEFFSDLQTCPDEYLLWFHHVSWNYKMRSGRTLWEELCYRYNLGVEQVREMHALWRTLNPQIDAEIYHHVDQLLNIQEKEAIWWRDACVSYFQKFSNQPIPKDLPKPAHDLQYYMDLNFPYAPH